MKRFFVISVILFLCLPGKAQFINIPQGTTPEIDGDFAANEWDDAAQATIYVQTDWTVTVFYKHSDTCLYLAFTDVKGVYGERYPDVMLDINNDKSTLWAADDWWLHASYNDCEGNGVYNVWASCQPTHSGWVANNFPLSMPGTIEMGISYSKIGLLPNASDTIGIALEVSDTYTNYHYYPPTAAIDIPSTWGQGILSASSSVNEMTEQPIQVGVFPNPSTSFPIFKFQNFRNDSFTLSVYNSFGQLIRVFENITDSEVTSESNELSKGIYFFTLTDNASKTGKGKFIIE